MPYLIPNEKAKFGRFECVWKGICSAGETVSGDAVFEEFPRADGGKMILLLDASGHGPAAAEYIELVAQQLQAMTGLINRTPIDLLAMLHSRLAPFWAKTNKFVCATAVLLDGDRSNLTVANAGQPYPIHIDGDGPSVWKLAGTMLGIPVEVPPFTEQSALLTGDDALLLVTDGVTEAEGSGSGQLLGTQGLSRLWSRLNRNSDGIAILAELFTELQQMSQPPWPKDDTTAL